MEYLVKTGEDIDQHNSVLVTGDTVLVEAGEYGGLSVGTSGVTWKSIESRQAKTGQWYFQANICDVIIDGFDIYNTGGSNGINMNAGSNERNIVKDCNIHPVGGTCGVDIANSGNDNVVEDCDIHDCHYAFHTSNTTNHNNIFQRNHCWNFSGDVINVSPSASGTKIIDNIMHDADDDGVHLFDDGTGQVTGNLIYNCKGIALWVNGAGGILTKNNAVIGMTGAKWNILFYLEKADHEIKNNIFYVDDSLINLFNNEGSGVIDYNCWYNPSKPKTPEGEHGIAVDPKFVDPNNSDYTLQADSPCIGTGEGGVDMGYTSETGEPPEPPPDPPEGVIEVRVTMTTGAGSISGAVTDADGVPISGEGFALSDLPAGTYTITCIIRGTKVGYRYNVQSITVGE